MQRIVAVVFVLIVMGSSWADEVSLETDSVTKDYAAELPRIPPTDPVDSLKKFTISDGFEIELAASEPLIADPIAMAFDEQGRLFVACMRGYSEHRDDRLGVIRLLEDTNEDGVFDRASDHVKDLAWPTAIACHRGGLLVGVPPNIVFYKDTDSDGIADQQEVLYSGFGHQNVQGMLNSFRWGLDNRLYGAAGLNGGRISKGGNNFSLNLSGRDFSIDPCDLSMRPESGGAQHGATFDRWGERFVCSNSDHLQWIEFDDRHLRRNPYLDGFRPRRSIATDGPAAEVFRSSPVEAWRIVRTRLRVKGMVRGPVEGGGRPSGYFTSASGITAYTGDGFPPPFDREDFLFVGDVGSNLVHLKRVISTGLEKTAVRATARDREFLTSTDNWFRPVQFANGPDGALYVVDMYRETIEHPLSLPPMIKKHVDLNSGRTRGRIYRIKPKDWIRPDRLMPAQASDNQLVAMLGHANGWHRETAARLIVTRCSSTEQADILAPLLISACSSSEQPLERIHALYCLHSIGRIESPVLVKQLQDKHPRVRQHALRVAESSTVLDEQLREAVSAMASDENPLVRYQLALTLGRFEWDHRKRPLIELASKSSGPGDANTTSDQAETKSYRSKINYAVLSSTGDRQVEMLDALLVAGLADQTLANQVAHQIGQGRGKLGSAMKVLRSRPLDIRDQMVSRMLVGTGQRGSKLLGLLRSQNVDQPELVIQRQVLKASERARDASLPLASRISATSLLSLGDFASVSATLRELLAASQPASIREAAVEQIGRFDELAAGAILLEHSTMLHPLARRRAFDLLTSRENWAMLLLGSIRDAKLDDSQLSAQNRQRLLKHRNRNIADLAKAIFRRDDNRTSVVDRMARLLESKGNVAKGRIAFRKVCASCHRLEDHGENVGPDLQPLRNRGAEFMLVNILDPNREVDPRYEACSVVTSDGIIRSGIVTSETDSSVTVLQANGAPATIEKRDIDEFHATGRSLMPEGLERDLTEQGIADVVAYLIQPVATNAGRTSE